MIRKWLLDDRFRLLATLFFALTYSLLRETEFSTFVKPLPVLLWLLILLLSPARAQKPWVVTSLICAALGDVLLDLGPDWLIIATVPFLAFTLIMALALYLRAREGGRPAWLVQSLILLPLMLVAFAFHSFMAPRLADMATIGGVLMSLSVLLLWAAVSLYISRSSDDPRCCRLMAMLGACGIVGNYVLYAINLGLYPIPRDIVIWLYYLGQAALTWSFLRPQTAKL